MCHWLQGSEDVAAVKAAKTVTVMLMNLKLTATAQRLIDHYVRGEPVSLVFSDMDQWSEIKTRHRQL